MNNNARRYPIACTSAYCGKCGSECNGKCPHYAKLREFVEWKAQHNAYCPDPVWSPNFYVAR